MLPNSRYKFSWPVSIISLTLLAFVPANALPNAIAVLPFKNLSPDPENAFIAAGIHHSTLNQLAKIHNLIVIGRSSVMQFEDNAPPILEIAEALNVVTVMQGSVRYDNGRVLIRSHLIDGRTGAQLWSQEFNRDLVDLPAVQTEIAERVAMAMQVQLLPDERSRIENRATESTEAYQYYIRARSLPGPLFSSEYLPAYINLLERAVAVDPSFSEAVADLAWGYYTRRERDTALNYARKAIALDPTSGSAFSLLGVSLEQYYSHQAETRVAYERALELSPNDPDVLIEYGSFLVEEVGENPKAIRIGKRTVAIDPSNASFHGRLGYILLNAGDLPAAVMHLREAIRLDSSVYMNYFELATAGYLSDDRSAARESLDHAVRVMESGATFRVGYLAYLYGLLDEPEQAAKLLAQYEESLGGPEGKKWRPLGWALLGTGDNERALRDWTRTVDGYLEENQPVSRGRISRFRDNWLNDPMLEQAEFLQLRRRLGFREYPPQ